MATLLQYVLLNLKRISSLASIMLMLFRLERGCRQAMPWIEHLKGQTILVQEKGCHGMSLAVFTPLAMNFVTDES
jgi:hypothetical protein